MDQIIYKETLPFLSTQKLFVPPDAKIVSVEADTREPGRAAIWYQCTQPDPELEDVADKKMWEMSVIYTGDLFPRSARPVGHFVDHGYAFHVICLNPSEL